MRVEFRAMSRREWRKAITVGIATGAVLAVINVIAMKSGLSPLPEPLGLAFAETLLGRHLPLPVGLAFHLVWVTLFCVVYLALWRDRPSLKYAAGLAGVLWLAALVVFFPIVGWGVLGLALGGKPIIPVTVSHALFAAILWGLSRLAFGAGRRPAVA